MKTKVYLFVMTVAMLMIFASCGKSVLPVKGNGDVTTELRSVSEFDKVSNEGEFDVYIIQDEVYSVTIEAESNLIGRIRTENHGSTLEISTRDNLKPSQPMKLIIRTPHLNSIHLSGSGLIDLGSIVTTALDVKLSGSGMISGEIEAEEVILDISGSGTSQITLHSEYLESHISGSGSLFFAGVVNTARLQISGSGTVKAFDLPMNTCQAGISGSGDMYVNVAEQLDVAISGSGSVYYIGYPDINTDISGSGRLVSMN